MNSRIPRTPSGDKWRDEFRRQITGSLVRTGYSAIMGTEEQARAMAKLGATAEERAMGEQMLSIIAECLDDRERWR